MEYIESRALVSNRKIEVDLSSGVTWMMGLNEECLEEVSNFISLAESQEFEFDLYGILLRDNSIIKSFAKKQQASMRFIILEDKEAVEKLGIQSIPWYVGIKDSRVLYSSNTSPKNFNLNVNEIESSIKKTDSDARLDKNISENNIKNENKDFMDSLIPNIDEDVPEIDSPRKSSVKSPVREPSIKKSNVFSTPEPLNKKIDLEKALKKIDKLRQRLKEKDEIIEDYKLEVKELRSQLDYDSLNKSQVSNSILSGKSIENQIYQVPKPSMINAKNINKPETLYKNKYGINLSMRVNENEFWKIDDSDELHDSIKFEDIVASKELWLMGLLKSDINSPKPNKNKILPPLKPENVKKSKLPVPQNKSGNRSASNNPQRISSKKILN